MVPTDAGHHRPAAEKRTGLETAAPARGCQDFAEASAQYVERLCAHGPALLCSALPCPALRCPALPCPAPLYPAWHRSPLCFALPCHCHCPCPCPAPCTTLRCPAPALPCPALHCHPGGGGVHIVQTNNSSNKYNVLWYNNSITSPPGRGGAGRAPREGAPRTGTARAGRGPAPSA